MKTLFTLFMDRRAQGMAMIALLVTAGSLFPLRLAAQNAPQPPAKQAQAPDSKLPAQAKLSSQASHAGPPDRGQAVFNDNCARCHTPPDGFSPRISKAVAMHMRVRANLSEADYRALLHFLNP